MKRGNPHVEDFGPVLNRHEADPEYQEIRSHLDHCHECSEELRSWQGLDELFRSEHLEVPPFQWQRIAARLQQESNEARRTRIGSLLRNWRPAWNIALGAAVVAAVIFSGLEYSRSVQEKQLLLAVTRYAQEEGVRISADGNPFRTGAAAENNPFTGIFTIDESKPAADRR